VPVASYTLRSSPCVSAVAGAPRGNSGADGAAGLARPSPLGRVPVKLRRGASSARAESCCAALRALQQNSPEFTTAPQQQ